MAIELPTISENGPKTKMGNIICGESILWRNATEEGSFVENCRSREQQSNFLRCAVTGKKIDVGLPLSIKKIKQEFIQEATEYNIYPQYNYSNRYFHKAITNNAIVTRKPSLDFVEPIIGHHISYDAIKYGMIGNEEMNILDYRKRNVTDEHMQFYVKTAEGYKRQVVTHRLSYITKHNVVTPNTIENQISLILYNKPNIYAKNSTRKYLARDFKIVYTKVLDSIIDEFITSKNDIDTYRAEHILRSFQMTYHTALYMASNKKIANYLYNYVMKSNYIKFEEIEEFMITASLVGISWDIIKNRILESIIRKFREYEDTEEVFSDVIEKAFDIHHRKMLHITLLKHLAVNKYYQDSFEYLKIIENCWGILPNNLFNQVIDHVKEIDQVNNSDNKEDYWIFTDFIDKYSELTELYNNVPEEPKVDTCVICTNEYTRRFAQYECTHTSCIPCAKKILNTTKSCPFCRIPVYWYNTIKKKLII